MFPDVSVCEIQKLKGLAGESILNCFDEGFHYCVVVVEARCDQVREASRELRNRRLHHSLTKGAAEEDRPEAAPRAACIDPLANRFGHIGMAVEDPIEIGVGLGANGWITEALEEIQAVLQPLLAWRLAALHPKIKARQNEMPEPVHRAYLLE